MTVCHMPHWKLVLHLLVGHGTGLWDDQPSCPTPSQMLIDLLKLLICRSMQVQEHCAKGMNNHHRHNRFTALLPGKPGWAGARRELLDFMVQGKINRGGRTNHPAGRHSIRTKHCPPPPAPIFYRPDALPADQLTVSKHWRQKRHQLECGPMPNVMAALPNIGGALYWTPAVWLMPTTRVPCSNAAKTRKPLKFAGVPQTRQQISAASTPKFTILWGHVGETLLFNKFFLIVDTCLSCEDTARQSCAMVRRWWFLCPIFSASRVQHISDLHSKFALRPHHVWKYGRHPISDRWY